MIRAWQLYTGPDGHSQPFQEPFRTTTKGQMPIRFTSKKRLPTQPSIGTERPLRST